MCAAQAEPAISGRSVASQPKGYRGMAMEGFVARWYTKIRSGPEQIADCAAQARRLTSRLPDGARVLEVAPGPGFLSIELARSGRWEVVGVDISRTFVQIARAKAREAGVRVTFQAGNASHLPFANDSFDLIVSQAAFKNFTEPQRAIDEMYRVLRPGGTAVIQDMRREASDAAIRAEVAGMKLGFFQGFMTSRALRGLRRRAYTQEQFERFARTSGFGGCELHAQGLGQEVRLCKGAEDPPGPARTP